MKCNYCGKKFATTQLDRDMFRNESWGTPYYYAKNDIFDDDIVKEAGFNPDDSENMLCPDCTDKIYDIQKKHADSNEFWDKNENGHIVLKLHSSRDIFSRLLVNNFTPWNGKAIQYPASAYLRVILQNGGKVKKYGTLTNSKMDLQIQFEYNGDIYTISIKDSTSEWKCSRGFDVESGIGSQEFATKIF